MTWQTGMVLCVTFVAAVLDLRSKKVPNVLTYSAALVALLLSVLIPPRDFMSSLVGFGGSLALYFLFHQFAGLGAGDAKLMAAVGALKGFSFVLFASFYILCAGFAAGILVLVWNGSLLDSLKWVFSTIAGSLLPRLKPSGAEQHFHTIPFAPAIFAGVAWTVWLEHSQGPLVLRFWN